MDKIVSERETQWFRWTPVSFVDSLYNTISDYINLAAEGLEAYLKRHSNDHAEVHKGVDRIVTLLEAALDKYFDKFDIYAFRNIFFIPPGARVFAYEQLPAVAAKDDHDADETLRRLQNELRSAEYTNAVLRKELEVLEVSVARLADAEQQLHAVAAVLKKHEGSHINDAIAHLLSTVDSMKATAQTAAALLATDFYVQAKQRRAGNAGDQPDQLGEWQMFLNASTPTSS